MQVACANCNVHLRNDRLTSTPAGRVIDFLCRNLRHHHSRIKPTNAVAGNNKVGRVENMTFDENEHRAIDLRSLQLIQRHPTITRASLSSNESNP